LRSSWDLGAFANQPVLSTTADKDARAEMLREYVRVLTPTEFCLRLIEELADASDAADRAAEATFWQIQREVLQGQIMLAEQQRREAGHHTSD
jgi:uncharacterized membrane protein YccC